MLSPEVPVISSTNFGCLKFACTADCHIFNVRSWTYISSYIRVYTVLADCSILNYLCYLCYSCVNFCKSDNLLPYEVQRNYFTRMYANRRLV